MRDLRRYASYTRLALGIRPCSSPCLSRSVLVPLLSRLSLRATSRPPGYRLMRLSSLFPLCAHAYAHPSHSHVDAYAHAGFGAACDPLVARPAAGIEAGGEGRGVQLHFRTPHDRGVRSVFVEPRFFLLFSCFLVSLRYLLTLYPRLTFLSPASQPLRTSSHSLSRRAPTPTPVPRPRSMPAGRE
ncbi:hypothetical protein B0H12DRAFT_231917 [Mycena haematopus]|nr:hypothetical protein B0H12DRAFT_231917 [Mycena haematopus]